MMMNRRAFTVGALGVVMAGGMGNAASALSPKTTRTALIPWLPAPSGRHAIGRIDLHLIDPNRDDPWTHQPREIMVSVSYPARETRGHPLLPYWPTLLAERFGPALSGAFGVPSTATVEWGAIRSHSHDAPPARRCPHPVVLFSPKHLEVRASATVFVEDLVSRGYVVVTTESTHEAFGVQFPGGRWEETALQGVDVTDGLIRTMQATRVADLRFVLDALEQIAGARNPDAEGRALPSGLSDALDLQRIGHFGSVGGGSAGLEVMHEDARLGAVIAMTDSIGLPEQAWMPVATVGTDRPFLLISSDSEQPDPRNNHRNSAEWRRFWRLLRGWKLNLQITGSTWNTFMDYEAFGPQIFTGLGIPGLTDFIGTARPQPTIRALREYLAAFFDTHLRDRHDPLLDRPSAQFPGVRFIP